MLKLTALVIMLVAASIASGSSLRTKRQASGYGFDQYRYGQRNLYPSSGDYYPRYPSYPGMANYPSSMGMESGYPRSPQLGNGYGFDSRYRNGQLSPYGLGTFNSGNYPMASNNRDALMRSEMRRRWEQGQYNG